jgi:hypothetical protein
MPRNSERVREHTAKGNYRKGSINRERPTTKHDYYEKTYQFIDRLFIGAGWSRFGPAASRTAITIKGQARPGKSARNSSTAQA